MDKDYNKNKKSNEEDMVANDYINNKIIYWKYLCNHVKELIFETKYFEKYNFYICKDKKCLVDYIFTPFLSSDKNNAT